MCKSLISFRHAVDIVLFLNRPAPHVGGVAKLVGELLGHGLFRTRTGIDQDPPDRQARPAVVRPRSRRAQHREHPIAGCHGVERCTDREGAFTCFPRAESAARRVTQPLTELTKAAEDVGHRTILVEASPFWSLLFLNNNLHIAHHERPKIAWYLLPAFYRAEKQRLVARNGNYLKLGYGQIFVAYFFHAKEDMPHPNLNWLEHK